MNLAIFKRKHERAEIEDVLARFDAETQANEARIAELRKILPDLMARNVLDGELDKDGAAELKKARGELAALLIAQEGRAPARERIAAALGEAIAEERRAARVKLRESLDTWGQSFDAALGGVADALRDLGDKILAAQRAEGACPVRGRPVIGTHASDSFLDVLLEGLARAGGRGLDPQRFGSIIAELKGFGRKAVYFAEDAGGFEHTA